MNDRRPNVIFVLTDDQGAWALGAAGNQEVLTPNLDWTGWRKGASTFPTFSVLPLFARLPAHRS